jgi:hypothetical protein
LRTLALVSATQEIPPSRWRVVLTTGEECDVWAHACEGLSGPGDTRDYTFSTVLDIDPKEQERWPLDSTAPNDPTLVTVVVARFPRSSASRVYIVTDE